MKIRKSAMLLAVLTQPTHATSRPSASQKASRPRTNNPQQNVLMITLSYIVKVYTVVVLTILVVAAAAVVVQNLIHY